MATRKGRINFVPVTLTDDPAGKDGRTRVEITPDDPQQTYVVQDMIDATGGAFAMDPVVPGKIVIWLNPGTTVDSLPFLKPMTEGAVTALPGSTEDFTSAEKGDVEAGGDMDDTDGVVVTVSEGKKRMKFKTNGKFSLQTEETTGVQGKISDPSGKSQETRSGELDRKGRSEQDPSTAAKSTIGPGEKPKGAESEGQELANKTKTGGNLDKVKGAMGDTTDAPSGIDTAGEKRNPGSDVEPAAAKPMKLEYAKHPVYIKASALLGEGKRSEAMNLIMATEEKLIKTEHNRKNLVAEMATLDAIKKSLFEISDDATMGSRKPSFKMEGRVRDRANNLARSLLESQQRSRKLRTTIESALKTTDVKVLREALTEAQAGLDTLNDTYTVMEQVTLQAGKAIVNKDVQAANVLRRLSPLLGVPIKTFSEAIQHLETVVTELRAMESDLSNAQAVTEAQNQFLGHVRQRVRRLDCDNRGLRKVVEEFRSRAKVAGDPFEGRTFANPKLSEHVNKLVAANPHLGAFREELIRSGTVTEADQFAQKLTSFVANPGVTTPKFEKVEPVSKASKSKAMSESIVSKYSGLF